MTCVGMVPCIMCACGACARCLVCSDVCCSWAYLAYREGGVCAVNHQATERRSEQYNADAAMCADPMGHP
jgi:hypothetical protein